MGYGNCSSGPAPSGKPWEGYYYSAYGIAVKHGFEGTEEEWLESLRGPNSIAETTDSTLDGILCARDGKVTALPENSKLTCVYITLDEWVSTIAEFIHMLNLHNREIPTGASVVNIGTNFSPANVTMFVNKGMFDGRAITISGAAEFNNLELRLNISVAYMWELAGRLGVKYPKLNGKKIYIYGGSYSDQSEQWYKWPLLAQSYLPDSVFVNRAHSGHCIASIRKTEPTTGAAPINDYYYSISNMVLNETGTDADAIILFGGTNDYLQAKPLGAFGAATPDQKTVCGALDLMAQKFHTIGPKAQVFVVTLPKLHPITDRTAWESGNDYAAGIVRRITEDEVTTNYKCIQAHTSSDANKPGSGAYWETYWEVWTDRDLCPPIVLRTVLATWASKNGYTLIDGYNFPFYNPYNDLYNVVQPDGIHYEWYLYSDTMAQFLLDKMESGGDATLASDLTKIDVSGSPGSLFTPTSANAYYGSDGRVNLVVKGTSTTSAGKNIITLPAHLRPIESERCFARVEAGGTVYVAPCSINASTGVIAIAGVAATGSSNIEIKATYDTVFSGYNPDPA